ncbi:MAG: mannose-1-phosphate guanylyltransferase, partial [Bacteroidia bacterium]|nr:mannose-1-phosphate guanylyltransferase [Bacteroidia bacterium]
IQPSRPDTGYGYIQFNSDKGAAKNEIYKVKEFKEKPNLENAKKFVDSGEYLWNAGIFIWNAKMIKQELANYLPAIHNAFEAGNAKYNTESEMEYINEIYPKCESISIDFGVMEKSKTVYVQAAEFGWSDLGTYGSLYEHLAKDDNGNAIIGPNVMPYESSNCIVNVENDKLVVMQGLDDYIVVESDGTLLICKKEDEQKIKAFVNDVKSKFGEKYI